MGKTHFQILAILGWLLIEGILIGLAPSALGQSTVSPSLAPAADDARAERPVKVLQNRYFLKAMRPELSGFGGVVLNESYSRTILLGARVGLFPTESWGIEAAYGKFIASDSADLKALKQLDYYDQKGKPLSIEPSYVRLNSVTSLTGSFVPIYGKINLLDWNIIYSDLYVNAGLGLVGSTQGNKTAFVFGGGQRFYFAKNYNVRVDAVDNMFRETRDNLGKSTESWHHAWTVTLGFSAFLTESK